MLAIIPARGGSKGIPRKNLVLLGGKPLIQHTIEAAQQSQSVSRIVLTTDDAEIAALGREIQAAVDAEEPSAPIVERLRALLAALTLTRRHAPDPTA